MLDEPIMRPELDWERRGDVNEVVFVQGAVPRPDGSIYLTYGAADRNVGRRDGLDRRAARARCAPPPEAPRSRRASTRRPGSRSGLRARARRSSRRSPGSSSATPVSFSPRNHRAASSASAAKPAVAGCVEGPGARLGHGARLDRLLVEARPRARPGPQPPAGVKLKWPVAQLGLGEPAQELDALLEQRGPCKSDAGGDPRLGEPGVVVGEPRLGPRPAGIGGQSPESRPTHARAARVAPSCPGRIARSSAAPRTAYAFARGRRRGECRSRPARTPGRPSSHPPRRRGRRARGPASRRSRPRRPTPRPAHDGCGSARPEPLRGSRKAR